MDRRDFVAASGGLALLGAGARAQAQETGALRIIVGFPAGGAPDAVARVFAEQLRIAGLPAVVENRVGAGGRIGIDALIGAPPDGRTVALIPASLLALLPQVTRGFRHDPLKDFVPLAALAEYEFALGVGPGAPGASLVEYLAWARANPGRAGFATPGLGTPQHFLGTSLAKAAGVELVHVPYKGGAQAMADVLGGQVPSMITTAQLLVPQHTAGKLRTVMVTGARRHPRMPDVPTAREAGFGQLEAVDWFGLFAARSVPDATVQALRRAATGVAARAEYAKAVSDLGYAVSDPDATRLPARLEGDLKSWSARVREAGFVAGE
jgi:tripartite-type tricarboxylate transporter receptor subunit TctC